MKKIFVLVVIINVYLFGQSDWGEINGSKNYYSVPQSFTYEDSSYIPMRIGNLYQFIESGYGGGVVWYYLRYGTVSRDTLINNQTYSLYTLHNVDHWFRYSGTEKKLYEWYNENEMLYMDFNLAPGDTFTHLTYPYPATVVGGDTNLFSMDFAYRGLRLPIINGNRRELFAQGMGLFYSRSENTLQNNNRTFSLIMAKLIDSLGNTLQFTNHYKPVITINPITLINTGNFSLGFKVIHQFDKPVPPGHTPMFFISSVKFDSYYSRQDSIIQMPMINATGIRDYYVNTILDTMLMKNGFDFNYRIIAVDKGIIPETSYSPDSGYYKCIWNGPTGIDDQAQFPLTFSLSQNYPNPFNPSTIISYQLPIAGIVRLKVYDVLGREVTTLVDEYKDAGSFEVEFDGSQLASGVYYYQLNAEDYLETRKMILLK